MNYIIDGRTMKAADHYTIETIGIPSLVLMERAAFAGGRNGQKEKIDITRSLIVCGSGNNGGDGIAVGRLLLEKGAKGDGGARRQSGSLHRGGKGTDPHLSGNRRNCGTGNSTGKLHGSI